MNKSIITTLGLLLGASSLIALPQQSIADQGQFYIAPGISWTDFDGDRQSGDDLAPSLGVGYDITDQWSAEINGFEMDIGDTDITHYRLDFLREFENLGGDGWYSPLKPFLVGGFGHYDIDEPLDSTEETLVDFGGGLKYELNDNLELRTALRTYYDLGEAYTDVGIDVSLVYRFGGEAGRSAASRAPAQQQPAPTQPAVADRDRDGVPDNRDDCPDTPRTHQVDDRGCSIIIEEVARVELGVEFEFDQDVVREDYYPQLNEVAEFLQEYDDTVVELEGHTDSVGPEEYNQTLSERRVNAVRQILIDEFDIQPGRVSVSAFGESRPITTNDTPEGRARNRRVVAVLSTTVERPQVR